jgi:nucleoside-diphosphate-sugar epimerase
LLDLAKAPRESLTRTAYNLTAFSPTAQQIHDAVMAAFPRAAVHWATDAKRQSIVDSWPQDVDDRAARRDWGFEPRYDFKSAFDDYLIPNVRERYA